MSTKQRVSRRVSNIKREDEAKDQDMLDAQDDELDRAEARLKQKKGQKQSPSKKRQDRVKHKDSNEEMDSSDEASDDDYDSEEMNDFIAPDEVVEKELYEQQKNERKRLRLENKRDKTIEAEPLCEDDVELIRENVGIEMKKKPNRLKRMAAIEESKDGAIKEETVQIDTAPKKSAAIKHESSDNAVKEIKTSNLKVRHDPHDNVRGLEIERSNQQNFDAGRLKKAQNIFGEEDDGAKSDAKASGNQQLQEMFNADDINDPFSTELDNKIAETDIPERLQVRLQKERIKPSEDELRKESEWILDRLTCMSGDAGKKYGKLLTLKDVREKIFKVLKLFRVDLLDIPMIVKYRKYEYADDLDEEAVWHIYNLDFEYGKFLRYKAQIREFLSRVTKFDIMIQDYDQELNYAKNQSDLNNFTALIRFLRSYYQEKLTAEDLNITRKQPQRRDEIQVARTSKLHEFAQLCFLSPVQYAENIRRRSLVHKPPEPRQHPSTCAADFQCEQFPTELDVFQAVCKFSALELAAQPVIRDLVKKALKDFGQLTTNPTEQGKKDLDLFHHSYRVKIVKKMPLKDLFNTDLYLDIMQCEKSNLVTVKIEIDLNKKKELTDFLEENYMVEWQNKESWNIMRAEVIQILVNGILVQELIKEVRDEIKDEAEAFVINKCKSVYRDLLMTGPFITSSAESAPVRQQPELKKKGGKGQNDTEIIKDRERLCVMGALMHQIDANNYIVTIAVVDRFGGLVAHKDFFRLLPPRQKRKQDDKDGQNPPTDRVQPKTDEENEHERDKGVLISILQQHQVDLIVVAANGLEARNLKRVMEEIASEVKNAKITADDDKFSKRQEVTQNKEAFVIWGSTEVAKLFAMSHNSQKMHKGVQQILKQTISLARFEQDPLVEVLNLWSPITAENQSLLINLDPMQKLVNQARLADGLEEINIQIVNDIGVDFNLVIEHEHMHCLLQFLSGLGPRMSKRLISKHKNISKKLATRGEILKQQLLQSGVYMSLVPFIKIRIPPEDFGSTGHIQKFDILDQTRIHHEHYKLAMKIATDACAEDDGKEVEKAEQNLRCKEVIAHPDRLKNLDLKQYYQQLEMTNMGNMRTIIEQIISEFNSPFKDPRQARMPTRSPSISNERLFYLLIDETTRTFKRGLIVTATVTKVLDTKAICRLENGLNAIIMQNAILEGEEKLKSHIDIGHIVTGRIDKINTDDDKRFEVNLQCKTNYLQMHDNYAEDLAKSLGISKNQIPPEDMKNHNFSIDPQPKQLGRFVPRRIAHEKFKNISSRRALAELKDVEVGEFVFRPSTRDENHITLTWKFWKNHFVHIDIAEHEKQPGAAIGSRLVISADSFDNLREIVERYIIPCNRLVRDVTTHPKWSDFDKYELFEEQLKEEKANDKTRIPYRFAIMPQYPQHIVLGYVPREKVVKEFIKVRPKGYYFHDTNHTPFISLVNWFKEQWSTKDYQRQLRKQKSPRTTLKPVGPPQVQSGQDFGQYGQDWQAQGGNSAHGNYPADVKREQNNYGRGGQRSVRKNSQEGWGDRREVKNEGNKSPGYNNGVSGGGDWGMSGQSPSYNNTNRDFNRSNAGGDRGGGDRQQRSNACHRCGQEGHMARECSEPDSRQRKDGGKPMECFRCHKEGHMAKDCTNQDQRPPKKTNECFKCHEEGHMARECPNQNDGNADRGYKRQRRDDGGSNQRRDAGNEGWGENEGKPQEAGWGGKKEPSGWGDKPNDEAKEHEGWAADQASNSNVGWQ